MIPTLIIAAVLFLIILIWLIGNYNRLVSLRQHQNESWADISVELKRRYDLIPQLVAVCQGYADHEAEVFTSITTLRNTAFASNGAASIQAQDESQLMREMSRLFAVVENYPELKADQQFLQLQHELANTEDRIAAARRFYNANVRDLRNMCQMFPSSIVANIFSFQARDFFELDSDAERVVPRVDF